MYTGGHGQLADLRGMNIPVEGTKSTQITQHSEYKYNGHPQHPPFNIDAQQLGFLVFAHLSS